MKIKTEQNRRDEYIFKNVKHHLNELKRLRPDYTWLFISAQGSQNYNLDVYEDDTVENPYISDVDTVAVVLPSVTDVLSNKKFISETIILDNNEHIDCKDLRLLLELFEKQNIKYLEILFSKYRILNPKYKNELNVFFNVKECLTKADPVKLITTAFGMQQEKIKALKHPYGGLKDKIAKYGYDPKQLHHIIRLYDFASKYLVNLNFEKALNSLEYPQTEQTKLYESKKGIYTEEEADILVAEYKLLMSELRETAVEDFNNTENPINVNELLESTKIMLLDKYMKLYYAAESEVVSKSKLLPAADKIYVTSDLHFGHENILDFEDKRWETTGTTRADAYKEVIEETGLDPQIDNEWIQIKRIAHHRYITEHDKTLIRNWNKTISENDVVFILGDFSFRTGAETNEILRCLNGRKILVKGNHENIYMDKDFDKSLYEDIMDYKELRLNKVLLVLSHYPIAVWNGQHKGSIHLYGHVHSNTTTLHPLKEEQRLSWNVGVDVNNFKPVCIKNYLQLRDIYTKQ